MRIAYAALLLCASCVGEMKSDAPSGRADSSPAADASDPVDGAVIGDDASIGDAGTMPMSHASCASLGLDPIPACDGASYYVDAAEGSDTSPGTSAEPWASLDHARSNAPSGATVCFRTGNYGSFDEDAAPDLTSLHVFREDIGHTPELTGLDITYANHQDANLTLHGFVIHQASGGAGDIVQLAFADGIRLSNLTISSYKWAVDGTGFVALEVYDTDDAIVDGVKTQNVSVGFQIQNTRNIRVLHNNIAATSGTGIQYLFGNTGAEIAHNHIHGVDWTPDADSPESPHASIISFRSGGVTLRGNHMHGMGNSSGIMFYDNSDITPRYDDVLVENNVLYDTINIYAARVYNLGDNFEVRNNIFFPGASDEGGCPDGSEDDRRYRMRNAFVVHSKAAGSAGIRFFDNIAVGTVSLSAENIAAEGGNLAWSWLDGGSWADTSPSGASTIVHSTRGDDCSHSTMFEDGSFFSEVIDPFFPGRDAYPLDPRTDSSIGDPGALPTQIDSDGFVVCRPE